MPAIAWPALGTTIGIDKTNSGTFSLIGNVTTFSNAGGGTMGQRETTFLGSAAHTFAPTIPDNGEFTFSVWFDPTDTTPNFVRGLKDANALGVNAVKVTYNDGVTPSTDVMQAFTTNFDGINGDGVDENLTADITMKVTGAVTHT